MDETLYLILGTVILLLTIYDFFFTTLSGSGTAFISRFNLVVGHKLLQFGRKFFGRKVYNLSGLVVNLIVLGVWVILVWLGLFLVFSSNPEAIVNSDGRIATAIERLYFTGYILSTLGMGNFKPLTPFFEILTSCFSFFGFIFFTTSMTYLISVSSSVIHKRTMALSIRNLGHHPEELAKNLKEKDSSYCFQRISTLQDMLDRHIINHHAYPVLHYYNNPEIASSFSINIAVLDEAINILLQKSEDNKFKNELLPLRNSLTHFLTKMKQNYSQSFSGEKNSEVNLPSYNEVNKSSTNENMSIIQRRKVLYDLLKSEGFTWNDVYSSS